MQERIAEAVKRHLRRELLSRISRTVVFNALTAQHIREIIGKFITRLNGRLADQTLRLTLDESVYALLMENRFSPSFGARPMERAIVTLIVQPLAKAILEGRFAAGCKLCVCAADGEVKFSRK